MLKWTSSHTWDNPINIHFIMYSMVGSIRLICNFLLFWKFPRLLSLVAKVCVKITLRSLTQVTRYPVTIAQFMKSVLWKWTRGNIQQTDTLKCRKTEWVKSMTFALQWEKGIREKIRTCFVSVSFSFLYAFRVYTFNYKKCHLFHF